MARKYKEEIISPSLPPRRAIELFHRQLSKIDFLKTLEYNDPEVDKWENFTEQLIIQAFGKPHGNLDAFFSARHGGPIHFNMTRQEIQRNYLSARENMRKMLEGFIEQLQLFSAPNDFSDDVSSEVATKPPSREVFVVHGRDEEVKQTVARFLENINLKPIILHEQANAGQTLIEKFEAHANVLFAVALLTPDDLGGTANEQVLSRPRARQNVVFEMGYFFGRLGRKNVCALIKGDIEKPSDVDGIVYIPYDVGGAWKLLLGKEIKKAGMDIDLNQAI